MDHQSAEPIQKVDRSKFRSELWCLALEESGFRQTGMVAGKIPDSRV